MLHTIGQTPRNFGFQHNRWRLVDLLAVCAPWLKLTTQAGLWNLLKRLDLSYKRARQYVHSPDPHYNEKLALIQHYYQDACAAPERLVFLYLDEFSFYRQPTLAADYTLRGLKEPLARRSYHSNTSARILAALNALTGQVTYLQRSRTPLHTFRDFYYQLRHTYPVAECIYVAQDNWPLHAHVAIKTILAPQVFPWQPRLPDNWTQMTADTPHEDHLPIQLLFLPTYAPWTNPIEKLWRWLSQERLHLHRLSDQWDDLKASVVAFLEQFAVPSPALLRYVGLLPI